MSKRSQGIMYIIAAGFFFSLMTFFVRLSGDLPTMQKAFFRNAVAAVVSFFMLLRTEEGIRIKREGIPFLLLRSICGGTGLICNFYAIDKLNIADANMLNKLSPFFAMIASYFILKEKVSIKEWITVAIAFLGALFVVKPSFQIDFLYGIVGVLGGLGAGVAYSYVRKLGQMGERGPVIVMFFSTFTTLLTVPFLIFMYEPMTGKQLLILFLAGCFATGGQLCITMAYTKAPAKEISVFDYSQVIFAALLGMFFLDQIPDYLSITGYIIILACAVYKWYYGMNKKTE